MRREAEVTQTLSSAQTLTLYQRRRGVVADKGEVKNRCLEIRWLPVVSKVEDEPLTCGNKVTCNWNYLFYILNPSRVTFILYIIAE